LFCVVLRGSFALFRPQIKGGPLAISVFLYEVQKK
jgi:hypothetical protein